MGQIEPVKSFTSATEVDTSKLLELNAQIAL